MFLENVNAETSRLLASLFEVESADTSSQDFNKKKNNEFIAFLTGGNIDLIGSDLEAIDVP